MHKFYSNMQICQIFSETHYSSFWNFYWIWNQTNGCYFLILLILLQYLVPILLMSVSLSTNSHAAWAAAGTASLASATTIGPYPPVSAHQAPVPAPLANQNPINNLPANQNPAQDAAFINPGGANQNMRMNAQGGPVMEDEEDVDRDWLDWMYSAARFGVLLVIVYFNSSLSRFVLVMSTLLLMYL